MRRRIRCLWHQEATASLVQCRDGWRCYGVCQKLYSNKEVEERTGEHYEYIEEETEKEDLAEKFRYIKSLRRMGYRGLEFPSDARGYYVTWPNDAYYKYRVCDPGKGSKYIGPRGFKPPLFWAREAGRAQLTLVEGEINALSVSKALPEWDVCSPGSASMFNSDNLSKHLTEFKKYSNVLVVVDNDAAGLKALIETKAFFLYKIPFVSYISMTPDANDVLVEEGPKALREKLLGAGSK